MESFGLELRLNHVDIMRLILLECADLLEKVAKQFCSWPMARLTANELPKQNDFCDYRFFLGDSVRRWINCYCASSHAERYQSVCIASSILKWKGTLLPVKESFIQEAIRDHCAGLTTPSECLPGEEDIYRAIDSVVNEVFWTPHEQYSFRERKDPENVIRLIGKLPTKVAPRYPLPSISACFERTRSGCPNAGSRYPKPFEHYTVEQFLLEQRQMYGSPLETDRPLTVDQYNFANLCDGALDGRGGGGAFRELSVDQDFYHLGDDVLSHSYRAFATGVLLKMLYVPRTRKVETIYGFPFEDSGREPLVPVACRPAAVLEPCKVRMVTMGEARYYQYANRWNRLVYKILPNHPTFRLLKGPLVEEDLNQFDGKKILSGDYERASDTLDSHYSEYVLKSINRAMGVSTQFDCLVNCLTRHRLHYDFGEFDQKNGQLMGSPVSFPVLCILNAAINRLFLDPTLSKPLWKLPMLINGDDILMSHSSFEGWEECVARVGLRPSLGKNYVHDSVCCINSEFWIRRSTIAFGRFEKVYPVRLNLIFQEAKTEFGGRSVDRDSIGAVSRKLVEGHPEELQKKLLTWYIHSNQRQLMQSKRSWFLPEQLGGLGLPTHLGLERVSQFERRVAAYLLTRPDPQHTCLYSPSKEVNSSYGMEAWMSANKKVALAFGLVYGWGYKHEFIDGNFFSLTQFAALGLAPRPRKTQDMYAQLRALVLRCPLKPVRDCTLLDFYRHPREHGWRERVKEPIDSLSSRVVVDATAH